jgi:putative aldouronate transport system substrate-binding protein
MHLKSFYKNKNSGTISSMDFKKVRGKNSRAMILFSLALLLASGLGWVFYQSWNQPTHQIPTIVVNQPGKLPIVNQPITLTGFIPSVGFIPNLETNAALKTMSQLTNVKFQWTAANKLNARGVLSLLLAGEQLPCFIQGASGSALSFEDLTHYGSQGIFLPLNDLIDTHGYYILQMFDQVPGLREVITAPDGNIYGLPAVFTDDYHMTLRQKFWINQQWLDRLGLDIPQTTEEFFQVMVAFRDQDANGNGDLHDEIPMTGGRRSLENLALWIMNAFVPVGGPDDSGIPNLNNYAFVIDGELFFSADKPEFRQGLAFLRRLYMEDLFPVNAFTQDRFQIRGLIEAGPVNRLGGFASHHPGNVASIGGDPSMRFREFVALPPIQGPGGQSHTPWFQDAIIEHAQFVITSGCDHPQVAIRLADFYYSLLFAEVDKGIEGIHWRKLDPTQSVLGLDGQPAQYEYLRVLSTQDNAQINMGPVWTRNLKNEFARTDGFSYEQFLFDASLLYEPYRVARYPYATAQIPRAHIEEFNGLRRIIHTFIGDSLEAFVLGTRNINSDQDWNSYLTQLNRLGLPRFLELLREGHGL